MYKFLRWFIFIFPIRLILFPFALLFMFYGNKTWKLFKSDFKFYWKGE